MKAIHNTTRNTVTIKPAAPVDAATFARLKNAGFAWHADAGAFIATPAGELARGLAADLAGWIETEQDEEQARETAQASGEVETVQASGEVETVQASGEVETAQASGEVETAQASGEVETVQASGEAETVQASGEGVPPKVLTVDYKTREGETVRVLAKIPAWSRKRGQNEAYALTYGSAGVAEARAAKLRAAGIAARVYGRGAFLIIIDPSGEVVAEACATLLPGRWIPGGAENAERIAFDASLGAEVWLLPDRRQAGALAFIAYSGKRAKHDAHYTVRDRAQALQWAGEYMGKLQGHAKRQAEQRAEQAARRAAGHKLAVGDVLRSSWGYDQTNIDYYEVTRLIGRRMVEIRKISRDSVDSGNMTGECVPRPGHYIGEPMRKAVSDYDGKSVRIASYASAQKIEPREVGGLKCYPVDHWTAYA